MTKLKSLHLALAAGSLAILVSGCGTMDRMMGHSAATDRSSDRAGSADRAASDRNRSSDGSGMSSERAGYGGGTASASTPAAVDPFARGYVPFPASANESAGILGQSFFCQQHYNQPGCQSGDSTPMDSRRP